MQGIVGEYIDRHCPDAKHPDTCGPDVMRQMERIVMSLVPDITAGTGTEFEETLVYSGSGGLSQSEGAQERVLSVDEFLSEWDCGVR